MRSRVSVRAAAAPPQRGRLPEQLKALGQPVREPCTEHGVADQAEQGGGKPEAEAGALAGIIPALLQHLKQGQVALEQSLEVPVFLQRARIAAPDVGEMGMKDQGQGAFGH